MQNEDSPSSVPPAAAQALQTLHARKGTWAKMPAATRLAYLKKILARLQQVDHDAWGAAATTGYGLRIDHADSDFHIGLESMINAGVCTGTVRHLIRTVAAQAQNGRTVALKRGQRGTREVVQVFPVDQSDRYGPEGLAGCTGEVWRQPDADFDTSSPPEGGAVCLVLGAGNQSFLAFGDVIYHLFVEGTVCLLKHHPLRAFSASYFDEIFCDLIEDGFFYAFEATLEATGALIHNPLVDRVHMTGGTSTHDAIVWGANPELQAANKAANTPVLRKPMTSELGAVTPWIALPGSRWSDAELSHMAGHLVAAFTAQNSCNCLSPKLLVLDADWPQADAFVQAIRDRLTHTPLLPPHYPGTAERYRGFQAAYGPDEQEAIQAPVISGIADHELGPCLPWLLLHLDEDSSPYAWQHEAFAPVLAIYRVRTGNRPSDFADRVIPFVNQQVWGSLSCTVLSHPTMDTSVLERVIAELRYGSIGVNTWTAAVYAMSGMTWGAYPGEALHDVASGRGIVRNAYALSQVEKSVLRSPFVASSHLIVQPDGRIPFTAPQLRAIRAVLLQPGLSSMLAMVREMATPPHGQSFTQKTTVWTIRLLERVLGLFGVRAISQP